MFVTLASVRHQVFVQVNDNVQGHVSLAIQNALSTDDLPVVSTSRPLRVMSTVRFVNSTAREANATISYMWSVADHVRPCVQDGDYGAPRGGG